MGCDIHFMVEKQNSEGKWEAADKWEPYSEEDKEPRVHKPLYYGRNYGLFAILANVRNGYGFAGIDTGDGFVPIAEPRGFPAGVTPEVQGYSDRWGGDLHSHSHFTVKELMEYDWTQRTKLRGVTSIINYIRWRGYDRRHGIYPKDFAADVSGRRIRKVSIAEADEITEVALKRAGENHKEDWGKANILEAITKKLSGPDDIKVYVQIEFGQCYTQVADDFLAHTMPRLWKLGDPDRVRIVFAFDN